MVCALRVSAVNLVAYESAVGLHSSHDPTGIMFAFYRTTYKDWMNADIRQILIETHNLPRPDKECKTQWGVYAKAKASDFFDAFKNAGFALDSKEVNSAWGEGKCVEWSFLKLQTSFFGDSIARTSKHCSKCKE